MLGFKQNYKPFTNIVALMAKYYIAVFIPQFQISHLTQRQRRNLRRQRVTISPGIHHIQMR